MSQRVKSTVGVLYGVISAARKRYRCDGHLMQTKHYIEPGDRYVASALPPDHPDIGNVDWWHHRFCMDCCPDEYAQVDA